MSQEAERNSEDLEVPDRQTAEASEWLSKQGAEFDTPPRPKPRQQHSQLACPSCGQPMHKAPEYFRCGHCGKFIGRGSEKDKV
jgi:hypothetical protein